MMGSLFSFLSDWAYGSHEAYILILGLDASGKTTILNRLKCGENKQTIPTIGFNCEHIKFGRLSFVGWDVGGQDNIRKLWHNYFDHADAVVFVIDSSDRRRFNAVRQELHNLTSHRLLRECPFLIFANKQDLPRAVSAAALTNTLGLHKNMNRVTWKMCDSTATTGEGIENGVQWLANIV